MKIKVLFMVINMNIGGTEKALLNMISKMSKHKYDITILMLEKNGGFLSSIPEWVNVSYLDCYCEFKDLLNTPPKKVVVEYLKRLRFIEALTLLFLFFLSSFIGERSILFKYILRNYKFNNEEYDIAVAYAGPMDLISFFIAFKINAKKKFQWIHFDISKIGFNPHFAKKVYKHYEKIFTVSNEGKNKLITILPMFKEKIDTFTNVLLPENLKVMADKGKGFEDRFDGIRILTVGRLSKEKGQDLAISVLAMLRKNGYNVRWYCIGEGNARDEYVQLIKSLGQVNNFVLLGSNPNPYPFMKQCDVYVQPSRHEGFCITLAEVKCFNKPIVTTNFTGAEEQIIHGKTGSIVMFNENDMYEAIKLLIEDKDLHQRNQKTQEDILIDSSFQIEKVFVY